MPIDTQLDKEYVAVVTGASRGIGSEVAVRLSEMGIFVYIVHRDSATDATKTKERIEKNGGNAAIVKCDITVESDVDSMIASIHRKFGRIDYLINNAGIEMAARYEDYKYSDWLRIVETNLAAKFLVTMKAIPLLKNSTGPRVVNLASRLAHKPLEGSSAYCCAAAAISMLTKCSALELRKYGIKVNAVMPGLTRTSMTEAFIHNEDQWENAAKRNPSGRLGKPSDVASVVRFLVSDDSETVRKITY